MKKKSMLLLAILSLLSFTGMATEIHYPAISISEALKKDADAVVRLHKEEFIVQSRAKALSRTHFVITIYNKHAKDYADMYVPYDNLSKVKSLQGRVYNALGEEVSKLKKKDIEDMSAYDGFSIFSDNRLKVASLAQNHYPYTVEWIYEVETENMMFYPIWVTQTGEKLAVEKSELIVEMPTGMQLRYWENALAPSCKITKQAEKTLYQWEVHHLPAIRMEPLSPSFRELVPVVYTAPYEFEVAGYAGKMDSWQSYGNWINLLNSTRNDLPAAAIEQVKRLTQDLPTNREKIKAVYDFLQANTRYVSIQLGIGGWQPFNTSFVYEKGYGDCKALSFYTKALLEAIEIPSYYTLIYAGQQSMEVREDFPMSVFNHVILCVPNQQDTIWLECTSQTNPFGYLSNFTSGRKAVMITEEGGKVVTTPYYQQEDNLQHTVAHVDMRSPTAANVSLVRNYQGLQFENHGLSHHIHLGTEEQQKWMYTALKIPSFEIRNFSFSLEEKEVPVATLHSNLVIRNLLPASGKRSFITLNLANQREVSYPTLAERKTDFLKGYSFMDTDSIIYYLPEGSTIEYLMEDIEIKSEFGEYHATAREEKGKIIYTRFLQEKGGRFPAGKYNDYIKFRQAIAKADQARAVIQNP